MDGVAFVGSFMIMGFLHTQTTLDDPTQMSGETAGVVLGISTQGLSAMPNGPTGPSDETMAMCPRTLELF